MNSLQAAETPDPPPGSGKLARPSLIEVLGPGLITGAADDDPSGIATYSQAGAQFGYDLGWTLLFSLPLMCAIQEVCARVGRVTGRGVAGNLKRFYPAWVVWAMVALLVVANTINIGADMGAMGAALNLVIGGPVVLWVGVFGLLSILLEVFVRYARYVAVLKWLTMSLFAYVAVALVVHVPWATVGLRLLLPRLSFAPGYLTVVVAVLGTTISPYLFFWQAQEEVEDTKQRPSARPLVRAPEQAAAEFRRIRWDTYVGMSFSALIALFILVSTSATLHARGLTDIQTSAQAALALRPIAGPLASTVFALGIIGTGLLALPVLAGSAAYALGEAFGWHVGLARRLNRARAFYGAIAAAMVIGALLNVVHIDPIKALFWSAVINGVAAVPIMAMIMHMAANRRAMGDFRLHPALKAMGWLATAVMALAAVGMFATMGA